MNITEQINKILYVDCDIYIKYYYRKCLTNDLPLEIKEKQKNSAHQYSFLYDGIDSGLNVKYRKDFTIDNIIIYNNDIIKLVLNYILEIIFNEGALIEGDNNIENLKYDLYQMYLSSLEIAITGEKTIKTYSNGYTELKDEDTWTIGEDIQIELLQKARNQGKNKLTDVEINNLRGQKINYLFFRDMTGMGEIKHSGVFGISTDSMHIKKVKKCVDLSVKLENIDNEFNNYLLTFNLLIKKIYERSFGGTTVPETCHAWRVFKNN
jgi:hypothetical protein